MGNVQGSHEAINHRKERENECLAKIFGVWVKMQAENDMIRLYGSKCIKKSAHEI